MKYAIAELSKDLPTLVHNEPIHRTEGDTETANVEAARITELREAIGVLQRHEDRIGYNAGLLYDTYCTTVGGVALNGDPLPDWQTFRADPGKQKQVEAWLAVGRMAAGDGGVIPNPGNPDEWSEANPGDYTEHTMESMQAPAGRLNIDMLAVEAWLGELGREDRALLTTTEPEQPRTIRQWLETLPDGYRERALANMDKGFENYEVCDLRGAIAAAFLWADSPEGLDFWASIADDNVFPPLPEPQ